MYIVLCASLNSGGASHDVSMSRESRA
jgi:hypothetical protein